MSRLCIYLFGPFHVTLDGEALVAFESNKVRALLAYLALEADRPHSRETLTGLLWPDQPERAARRNLSQALFNLRQVIHDDEAEPSFLCVTREAVQFNLQSDHWLDVTSFASHLGTVQTHTHANLEMCPACIQQLEQAEALYKGELLAGFFVDDNALFSDWAVLWRERFHHQVLDAQHRLAARHEQRRDYERACHYARRQVELEPWREQAHQQLMRLLVRIGQRSAALQQYETCRRILADELSIEPSEDTRRLYRRIKSAPEIGAHNLPPQPTHFVGRQAELRELSKRLADPAWRLLTLVGPGGIGKTRLAIQAALENRAAFIHGVCFTSLASLQSAEFLVLAIADALHLHGQGDLREQLLDALRGREMLLVLDNFEHLIQGGADLLVDILQAAPEVKLLVTTRERLNVYGEAIFDVGGLQVPEEKDERAADYSAVELFLQSAQRARAGFSPGEEWAEVARICRLVEGMPLGVELAAGWVRSLSCRQIAAEIEQTLAFLSASIKGLPPRHRSVQAAFDHSWERLADEDQRILSRLAVIRGSFDRQAAAQVAGAALAHLSALVDKSFLRQAQSDRYAFHELVRQYAVEKLGQDPGAALAAQDAQCRYYAGLARAEAERFLSGQQRQSLDAIEGEMDNLRVAWQWALDHGRYERLAEMVGGLYNFCFVRSTQEGDILFGKAVVVLEGVVAARSEADERVHCLPTEGFMLLGKLLWRWGHFVRCLYPTDEKTEAILQRSVMLLRPCSEREELAQALYGLGRFLDAAGRHTEASQVFQESIEIGHQLQDPRYLAQSLTGLAAGASSADELPQAKLLAQEGLAIHRKLGDLRGMTSSLSALSSVAYSLGDQAEAKRLCLETKALLDELGDSSGVTVTLSNVGHVCMEMKDYEAAAQYLQEALQKSVALRQSRFVMNVLHGLAELAARVNRYRLAYELATFVCCAPMTFQGVIEDAHHLIDEMETRLPPDIVVAARARAVAWTVDDAVVEALTLLEGE